jgi:hypothetical protein
LIAELERVVTLLVNGAIEGANARLVTSLTDAA